MVSWVVAFPTLVYEALTIVVFKMLRRAGENQKHPEHFPLSPDFPLKKKKIPGMIGKPLQ